MAFFALIVPIQAWTMQSMIEVRMDSMVYVSDPSCSVFVSVDYLT